MSAALAHRAEGLIIAHCSVCHSADLIAQQRLPRARWEATIEKMKHWGAEISNDEADLLVRYLSARYHPCVPDQLPPLDSELKKAEPRSRELSVEGPFIGVDAREAGILEHNCQAGHGAMAVGGIRPVPASLMHRSHAAREPVAYTCRTSPVVVRRRERAVDVGGFSVEVGVALRRARRMRGLTLRAVSALSGGRYKPTSIAGYERGERTIFAAGEHLERQRVGQRILRERPRAAAEQVPRELIEEEDEREATPRRRPPGAELPARAGLEGFLEPIAERAVEVSEKLRGSGFLVPAIRPPTVPEGTSRLRISLSAAHDVRDVERLPQAPIDGFDTGPALRFPHQARLHILQYLNGLATAARRRGLGPERLAQWMAAAPAKLAGLDHRKGRLAPGCDADFVVWDREASFRVDPARLHQRHPVTPYAGRELQGVVRGTWLRGRQVFDGTSFADPPAGRLLLRERAT